MILASVLLWGGVGFHLIENVDLITSFYWTVSTVTTVGYGDVAPHTPLGKVFASVLMLVGVSSIFYTLTMIGKNMVEGGLWSMLRGTEKEKLVKKMSNHVIICGYGRIGQTITEDLVGANEKVVIVENREDILRRKAINLPYIVGDATNEECLEKANIRKAKGLFATFADDSVNILVTLNAKDLNPNIRVISRAANKDGVKHLKRAKAEAVVLPEREGGLRMSKSFLSPEISSMDHLFQEGIIKTGAVKVQENSGVADVALAESGIRENTGVMVMAIKSGKKIITNPEPKKKMAAGDVLIVLGTTKQIQKLEELASAA
jgi:voltage-gated potassium channel